MWRPKCNASGPHTIPGPDSLIHQSYPRELESQLFNGGGLAAVATFDRTFPLFAGRNHQAAGDIVIPFLRSCNGTPQMPQALEYPLPVAGHSFSQSSQVFVWKPTSTYSEEIRSAFFFGHQHIHTNPPGDVFHNKSEPVRSFEHGMDTDDTGRLKMKRKKLKGKRAVVRWLKFFRWKKKKEYERMTAEEKNLYKLKKAQRKEARLMEALKKIEPPNNLETTHDPEILTPEEHFYYIKKAHKLKNYVPIGVRGISQGVILNMHLHWKKHETVKIIVKTFSPEEVKELAVELARLSGGIVLDIHEENTIIMYRGKNYSQPPTEIMSPKIALSRRKALDKAKIRDGLRAVRKYIPRLEQELELLHLQASNSKEKIKVEPSNSQLDASVDNCKDISDQPLENSEMLKKLLDRDGASSGDESSEDTELISDSESLSDIFETDSEGEEKEKAEQPLYLDAIERFPVDDDSGPEDFEEHLRQISSNSKKGKPSEKDINLSDLDEVDELFLKAGALLRKRGNKGKLNKR